MPKQGDRLSGKYRLLRPLGEGAMGQVWEAEHLFTGQRVAIKLLHRDLLHDEIQRQRFIREARACVRIAHPNIVRVFDLDLDDDGLQPYIVQELLHGQTLADLLDRTPGGHLDPVSVVRLLVPLMGALVGAHRLGVVHRDIKPANIFLCITSDGMVPKLIDFGIAKIRPEGGEAALTTGGMLLGSPAYMSPEQAAGEGAVDAQSDVWAMGVVMYEALTGQLPFQGETPQWALLQVLSEPVPPIETLGVAVPADLAAVVHRALERDRGHRFASMQRLVEAVLETSVWSSDAPLPSYESTEEELEVPTQIDARSKAPDGVDEEALTVMLPGRSDDAATTVRAPSARGDRRGKGLDASPRWVIWIGVVGLLVLGAALGRWMGS